MGHFSHLFVVQLFQYTEINEKEVGMAHLKNYFAVPNLRMCRAARHTFE